MEKEVNMSEVVSEVKNANEDELKALIEKWFDKTRIDGMKLGATMISAAVFDAIKKHLKKKSKASLRDYQRCVDQIIEIISVQLTQQNDSDEVEQDTATEDNANDGTAE